MPGFQMLKALWAYRRFVWSSVLRDFNARYRESLFGAFWAVANPLAMIIIYTVVFGRLMRPTLADHQNVPFAFSIFLCAGALTWNLFAEILNGLNGVFLAHSNVIKKANFPRICLPAIVVTTALINFVIVMALYLGFLAIIGHWPGWPLFGILPLLALQVLFALGLGVFLGTLNVFFRDVGQFTGIALQFWFWLTPIVYTAASLPIAIQEYMTLNPMASLMTGYQTIFLEQRWPDWFSLWPLLLAAVISLILGANLFLRRVGELVDEL